MAIQMYRKPNDMWFLALREIYTRQHKTMPSTDIYINVEKTSPYVNEDF